MRELAKYGICKTSIPVTDGTLHLEWLDQRRKVEGSIEQGEDEATRLVSDSAETSSSSSSLQRDLGVTASDGTSAAGGISAGIQYPISANPGAAALTNSNLLATLASSHALPIQMAFCLMPNFQVPPQQGSSSNLVPNQILLGMLSNHLNPYSSLASTNQGQLQVGQSGSIESLSAASLPSWLTGQRTSGNMAGDISAADVTYSAATRPHHKGATPNAPVKLLTVLYRDSDAGSLSDYQCFLRQQIEMFEASSDDVQYNASRMNRNIVLGQVGIRCRHCAKSSEWERAGGAVYYPGNLSMLYQAGQNMAKNHLCNLCKKIPQGTRDLLNLLRRDKRRAAAGKEYWSKTAKAFGVFENEKNGLKLMKKGNHLG